MEVIERHKISDLFKTLNLQVEQEIEFTILSIPEIHTKIPFKSSILRADYFSFILTKDGAGVYYLDDNKFPFNSNSLYFTNPGHTKSYELFEANEAFIITLTENFLRENVNPNIFEEFPFLLAEIVPPKELKEQDFQEYETIYAQIKNEYQKKSVYKNKILGSLLNLLLLKIKEDSWLNYNPIEEGNRSSHIVKSFKMLLEQEFKKVIETEEIDYRLNVQDFSEKLNLHPNYFNSVIKSKTGKTVYEWIAERTGLTAKSLLLNSPFSSKEISYKLGFSEPTHFNRFFKKNMQLSPGEFRKLNKF